MTKIFITATGTDIGKTFIAAALAKQLGGAPKVAVVKPIITGWENENTDTHTLLTANRQPLTANNLSACSPWRFKAALSPDMAAAQENSVINFDEVKNFCQTSRQGADFTIIEGAGGVMTPINQTKTFRNLILELGLPTVLVTGSYLGSISHCLTALESLHELEKISVVINQSQGSEVSLQATAETIANFCNYRIFTIKRDGDVGELKEFLTN